MDTVFPDAPSWPEQKATAATGGMGHNQAPLEESLLMEFQEELDALGITARVAQLLESAGKCPPVIEDETTAGKVGDLCRLTRDVEKRLNDARETHNRPLLNAQRALKGKADGLIAPLQTAITTVQLRLNAYVQQKEREAAEERRRQEEEARKAREAMEKAGIDEKIVETVTAPAPPPRAPIARGDLGGTVSARTVWKFERQVAVAKLPKSILEHPKVLEAVDQVIGTLVRTGTREIKGVQIFESKEASVR
jgi:hypothetical protein